VVLVHDGVGGAEIGERGDRAGARARAGAARGAAAAEQPVLGHDRDLHRGRQEPLAQAGGGEGQSGLVGGRLAVEERCAHAREVVGRALGLAAAGPGDDRAVARVHELLELGLGLAQRAGGRVGALGAELVRLVAGDRGQAERRPFEQLGADVVG
jgi:hypothetical protein